MRKLRFFVRGEKPRGPTWEVGRSGAFGYGRKALPLNLGIVGAPANVLADVRESPERQEVGKSVRIPLDVLGFLVDEVQFVPGR